MKLTRRLLNLLYFIVLKEMERAGNKSAGFKEDLIELEQILGREVDRHKVKI